SFAIFFMVSTGLAIKVLRKPGDACCAIIAFSEVFASDSLMIPIHSPTEVTAHLPTSQMSVSADQIESKIPLITLARHPGICFASPAHAFMAGELLSLAAMAVTGTVTVSIAHPNLLRHCCWSGDGSHEADF